MAKHRLRAAGAAGSDTDALGAAGDTGATTASSASPEAPPMLVGTVGRSCICTRLEGTPSFYGDGVIMGVFCHYVRGKVVYEHVLGG